MILTEMDELYKKQFNQVGRGGVGDRGEWRRVVGIA